MNIEAISGAATVAIACSIVFVVAARSWQAIARTFLSQGSFPDAIMREAAQRFRDELDGLARTQATYLSAGLLFCFVYAVAYTFQASRLFAGYPAWQLKVLLAVLVLAAALSLYRAWQTVVQFRQVRFLRDANVAIGHSLQRLVGGRSRVFHDVTTDAGIIDHVVVGPGGLYAVNVVARRGARNGSVQLHDNELHFSSGRLPVSLAPIAERTTQLESEFRQLLKHAVRVRSVIAVPGWNADNPTGDGHLVVNEKTLPMFAGWKSEADFLLDEDVDALQQELTAKCRR